MATAFSNEIVINKNLEAPPFRIPLYDAPGVMNSTWVRWLQGIFDRVGGNSGNLVYDNANSAQQTSSLEPQLYAIKAEIENQLTGIVLQIIEQVQEQTFDVSGLVADVNIPPVEFEPYDNNFAGIIQQGIDNAAVKSVFGRTGAVVAVEGDYALTQLSDVTISAPATNQILTYNGSTWVNLPIASTAPSYAEFVATAGQTVFNTTFNTTAKTATKIYLQVFVNGVQQMEGASKNYTVTGATQITFTSALALNDDVAIFGYV